MPNVKILESIINSKGNLLTIKGRAAFKKIYKKITKSKKVEFVWCASPIKKQMLAILLARLAGKKFLWIQSFSNPSAPDFVTRLLLDQADEIIVNSRITAAKLRKLGVDKPRIRLRKNNLQ